MVKAHVKARSSIVQVFGDYYYKEHGEEEVIASQISDLPDGFLKTNEDVEKFVSERLG